MLLVLSLSALTAAAATQPVTSPLGVLDASEPIPVFIEDGRRVSGFMSSDRELARLALDAWSRETGGVLRFVEATGGDEALVHVRWVSEGDGRFGEMERLDVGGRPGAVVFVTPDVDQLGPPLSTRAGQDSLLRDAVVYLTCLHELGHAVGLVHTDNFDDVMYWFGYGGDLVEYFMRYRRAIRSRSDIAARSGLSPNDIAELRALYPRNQ